MIAIAECAARILIAHLAALRPDTMIYDRLQIPLRLAQPTHLSGYSLILAISFAKIIATGTYFM